MCRIRDFPPILGAFRNLSAGDLYMSGGSGDVVVLLHGWPQTWFEWRDVMPDLAKRYRVIAADLPGLGDSGESASYDKKSLARTCGN